ncbi:MAG: leucine-rich repeat protein [Paludibacteraceae bacterium]|nr:leucine-rich repeat protein [Paludibacteraceae bacterium]
MKNIFNILLFALFFTSLQAQEDKTFEFTYEGQTLKYEIMSETEVAVIKQKNPGMSISYKSINGVESRDTVYSGPAGNVIVPSEVTFNRKIYKVTSIIKDAFEFNSYLANITLPSTLNSIDKEAFGDCPELEKIEVATDNKFYSSEDGVLFNKAKDTLITFPEKKKSLSYVVPSTVKQIEWLALRSISHLENIEVAAGNKYYSSEDGVLFNKAKDTLIAFPMEKKNLSYVVPNTVKQIKSLALWNMTHLENIEVAPDNKFYSSEDGVLFNKAKDTLLAFPINNKKEAYEIPKSVRTILPNAFYSKNLKSVTIPKTVKHIGMFAFRFSTIESVIISQGVKEIDDFAFANCSRLKNVSIPKSVNRIGMAAFLGCVNLERVMIPKGVKTIGEFAFTDCDRLKTVSIPESVTDIEDWAFVGCVKLDSVTIPKSVDRINKGTFACCETLTNLEIPKSVRSIADSAFIGCINLDSVMIPNSVTNVGSDAFNRAEYSQDLSLHSELKKKGGKETTVYHVACSLKEAVLQESCFLNFKTNSKPKTQIKKPGKETIVIVPDSENGKWEEVFKKCSRIKIVGKKQQNQKGSDLSGIHNATVIDTCIANRDGDTIWYKLNEETKTAAVRFKKEAKYVGYTDTITIPDKVEYNGKKYRVTMIENHAFEASRKLTAVIIPSSVTSIGDRAFRKCNNLTSVSISSGVNKIGKEAFWECYSLERIEVASKNKFFSSADGVLFSKAKDTLLFFPTKRVTCTIPNTVTHIGEAAFLDSDITSIEIPNGVKEIGNDAFNRSSLKEVSIPQSVTKIGTCAFYNCNLDSVVIPNSVISIGDYSFSMCSSLKTITVGNEEPPTVGELFFRTPIQTIYAPAESVEKYKTAKGWSKYADKIKAIGE